MKSFQWRGAAIAAAVCLTTSSIVRADFNGAVSFDDLTLGTLYSVGNSDTSNGVTITFDTFFWLPGNTPFNGGHAEVHDDLAAGGSGFDLQTNNINAHFEFGGDLTSLSILYGAFGGNLNIQVNGVLVNVGNWTMIDGTTIGGVNAEVTTFDFSHGRIDLTGTINSFAIGGQELWVDEVEYKLVPSPGALALLVAAGMGARTRRRK